MYHGEVLVSEEQLSSFLQTAKLLQVSGLNNTNENHGKRLPKKNKRLENVEQPTKKTKVMTKPKLPTVINSDNIPNSPNTIISKGGNETDEEYCADVNENVEVVVNEKGEQASILEAALEKPESILARSLTLQGSSGKFKLLHNLLNLAMLVRTMTYLFSFYRNYHFCASFIVFGNLFLQIFKAKF